MTTAIDFMQLCWAALMSVTIWGIPIVYCILLLAGLVAAASVIFNLFLR